MKTDGNRRPGSRRDAASPTSRGAGGSAGGGTRRGVGTARMAVAASVRDPVCGMHVDPAVAAATVAHRGSLYHFCSAGCAERFRADPTRYLDGAAPAAPSHGDVVYTCP